MGQSAVDLPDPLSNPADPNALSNADDLLAQLAGDEIDRLLAEADVEAKADQEPPVPHVPAFVPQPRAKFQEDAGLASEIDDLFAELTAPPKPPPTAATETPPAQAAVAAPPALEPPPAPPSAEAAVAAPQSSVVADAPAGAGDRVTMEDIDKLLEQEAAAIVARELPAAEPTTKPAGEAVATPTASTVDEAESAASMRLQPLPLWLRPLEWLSAPLDFCPEPVRDALGKVAILTLINAAAVIAYVLIFRRHR